MPHSTASRITRLSSERQRAKSKQSPSDCNNQTKGLNKGEKPCHALCERIMHFGKAGSNFYCFSDEGQAKEKYSRLAMYYMQNQLLQQSEISSNRIFSYSFSVMHGLCTNAGTS